MSTGRLFVVGMWLVGLVCGLLILARPDLREATILPAMWPFIVALLAEFVVQNRVAAGKARNLTMNERFAGVLGAVVIVVGFVAFVPPR